MNTTTLTLLRWTARITGTLLLLFLIYMFVGHLVGDANGPNGMSFRGSGEFFTFLLFPVCSIIGLALAYKYELLGGGLSVLSLIVLVALRPDLMQMPFVSLITPGALYVLYALTLKRIQPKRS